MVDVLDAAVCFVRLTFRVITFTTRHTYTHVNCNVHTRFALHPCTKKRIIEMTKYENAVYYTIFITRKLK